MVLVQDPRASDLALEEEQLQDSEAMELLLTVDQDQDLPLEVDQLLEEEQELVITKAISEVEVTQLMLTPKSSD